MIPILPDTQKITDERGRFWRDVLVFELKMFIGNLRDFALMPVSVGAAMIDLVSKGEREGSLFYRVLRWGAHSEEVLDAYSPFRRAARSKDQSQLHGGRRGGTTRGRAAACVRIRRNGCDE